MCFLHLIAHAFIKALLFVATGNIIHLSNDYQDVRKAGPEVGFTPLTSTFILISRASMAGMPFLAIFYSKDLWLEYALTWNFFFPVHHLFYLSVALTVSYSVRIIYLLLVKFRIMHPYKASCEVDFHLVSALGVLWLPGVAMGSMVSWVLIKN